VKSRSWYDVRIHRNVLRAAARAVLYYGAAVLVAIAAGAAGLPRVATIIFAVVLYTALAWPVNRMLDRAGVRDRQAITDRAVAAAPTEARREALRRWFRP
jgi:predicted PurR-regulated permease PerM